MPAIQPIAGSKLSPWSHGDNQHCILRTAGNQLTTMVPTLKDALDNLEVFPMGYTNLWILCRVGLYLPAGVDLHYAIPDAPRTWSAAIGRYFIWGDQGMHKAWVEEGEKSVLGFPDLASAEAFVHANKREGETYIIAMCMDDIMWH